MTQFLGCTIDSLRTMGWYLMKLRTIVNLNLRKLIMLTCFSLATVAPALAESPFLLQGIDAYNRGNYSDAMNFFGAAMGTDQNNAILHYYMANSLVQLKQKPDAIREYKLALELEPRGKMAANCQAAP